MNAAQLSAWLQANKKPVLAVAGVGAVGLGLMRARAKAATAGGEPTPGAITIPGSAPSALSYGPAVAGTMPYDSSAYDSYNDLQQQMVRLYDQVDALKAPVPVPEMPDFAAGFYKVAGGNAIYHVDTAGNRDLIDNMTQFRQMGGTAKSLKYVSPDSSFFRLPSLDSAK